MWKILKKTQVHGPMFIGFVQVLEMSGVIPAGTSGGAVYTFAMRFRNGAGESITAGQKASPN